MAEFLSQEEINALLDVKEEVLVSEGGAAVPIKEDTVEIPRELLINMIATIIKCK